MIHFITFVELLMEVHTITEHTCIYIKYCFHLSQSLSSFRVISPCYVSSASTVADDMAVCCLLTLCPLNEKMEGKKLPNIHISNKSNFHQFLVWTIQLICLTKTLDHIFPCACSCAPLLY